MKQKKLTKVVGFFFSGAIHFFARGKDGKMKAGGEAKS